MLGSVLYHVLVCLVHEHSVFATKKVSTDNRVTVFFIGSITYCKFQKFNNPNNMCTCDP